MAIPQTIKDLANKVRTAVYGKDVRESLAKSMEETGNLADETKTRQDSLETQFQSVLDETTGKDVVSAPEILAARVDSEGINHSNLKERLDQKETEFASLMAQKANQTTVGTSDGLPAWLQESIYSILKMHDDYLRQVVVNVRQPPYNAKADGVTDDTQTIQSALNLGGVIILPPGIYVVTDELRIPSNTTVLGVGRVILKRNGETSAILINDADGITGAYGANKNIQVKNIIFDANNTTFTTNVTPLAFGHCKDVKVIECEFKGCTTWHDLELNACDNVVVQNCKFEDYKGTSEALQIDYAGSSTQFPWFGPYDNTPCKNIFIHQNTFKSTAHTKTAIGNHSYLAGVVSKNIVIKENYFSEFHYILNLNDVDGLMFSDNYSLDCVIGVFFEEKQNASRNWSLIRNVFECPRSFSDTTELDGRFFRGQSTVLTKEFANIQIKGNKLKQCQTHAIGFTATRNVSITDNIIENSGRNGLYMYGGSGINIENNIMKSNNVLSEAGRADIVVGNNEGLISSDVIVSGNNVERHITGSSVSKVLVTSNIIKTSIANNGGAEGNHKNNLIAGVWTA